MRAHEGFHSDWLRLSKRFRTILSLVDSSASVDPGTLMLRAKEVNRMTGPLASWCEMGPRVAKTRTSEVM
jgi:hypothetical protein